MSMESNGSTHKHSQLCVETITFDAWNQFQQFVGDTFADDCRYVFRGQRCDTWLLEPSIARLMRNHGHLATLDERQQAERVKQHYQEFQYAIRGRRGAHAPEVVGDYLWALGQHFGLATPLLDWTMSPYVAAFFAFSESGTPQTEYRAVFAISQPQVEQRSDQLLALGGFKDHVYFLSPMSDENPRLVNQGGLFSRLPIGIDLEAWVDKYADPTWTKPTLLKMRIRDDQRNASLRSLARMNINHLSVFPDLAGASLFCNLALGQEQYALHLGTPRPQRVRIGR